MRNEMFTHVEWGTKFPRSSPSIFHLMWHWKDKCPSKRYWFYCWCLVTVRRCSTCMTMMWTMYFYSTRWHYCTQGNHSFFIARFFFFFSLEYLSCDVAAEYLRLNISCSLALLANWECLVVTCTMPLWCPLCQKKRCPKWGHRAVQIKCCCLHNYRNNHLSSVFFFHSDALKIAHAEACYLSAWIYHHILISQFHLLKISGCKHLKS